MEFCKFYGISVPQLLLLNNLSDVTELAGYLNNPLDFDKLQDFKQEIEFFVDFFQRAFPRQPLSKSRLKNDIDYTRWTLYENHINRRRNKQPEAKLSREELAIVNDVLRYKNISTFSQIVDRNGDIVNLVQNDGDDSAEVICAYFRSKIEFVPILLDKLNFTENKDSTIFGMTVMSIVQSNAVRLLNLIRAKFKNPKEEHSKAVFDEFDKNISLLESLINDTRNQKSTKTQRINYEVNYTSEQQKQDMELARSKNKALQKNPAGFKKLCELYNLLDGLDVDAYNSLFGLNKTKEEYEDIFEKLTDLGLVGLNFNALDFFKEFINTMSFSSEDKIVIHSESECAENIHLARRFLDTVKLKVGDVIE